MKTSKISFGMLVKNLIEFSEFWGLQSTPSLPLLPGPLWPRVVAPERALSMS